MLEGAYEQEVQSQGCFVQKLDVLFTQAQVHFDNKTRQISFDNKFSMTFLISPSEC